MPVDIVMPRMSDTMEEGKIVRWLKQPGDPVAEGEPLADIETDKAVMQLESYESGTIAQLLVPEGESAPIGRPIAVVARPSDPAVAAPAAPKAAPPVVQPGPAQPQEADSPALAAPEAPRGEERVKASPMARRLAEERGIDLSRVAGTGPGGRVTREDVDAYAAAAPVAPPPSAPVTPAARPSVAVEYVELSRMRRTIGDRMTQSKTTTPHFYVTSEIDMAAAGRLRRELKLAWAPDEVTYTDLIARAVALALRQFPDINASWDGGRIKRHKDVDVGVAVAVGDGLMVVVVRRADTKDLRSIAAEMKSLVERARRGRAQPGDYGGSTFTISNLGMFDVEDFIAIITPPEAAILAVASIRQVPVVADGQLAISERMNVTISGDHRVIDGAMAAQFLKEVKRLLQAPVALLR